MVGNNSASVVADAYVKGLTDHDIEALWQAVVSGANSRASQIGSTGRVGFQAMYNKPGLCALQCWDPGKMWPEHLSSAYDDWCIYQLGKTLGKPKSEINVFAKQAMNYKTYLILSTSSCEAKMKMGLSRHPSIH